MLAEAILHSTGTTTRLGKIEDGTTVSDFEDEEIRRKLSLSTAVIPVELQGSQESTCWIPPATPISSAKWFRRCAWQMAPSCWSIPSAGLEVGTEIVWNLLRHLQVAPFRGH